jgi:hypothetical protein
MGWICEAVAILTLLQVSRPRRMIAALAPAVS